MANISTVAPYVGAGASEPKSGSGIFRRVLAALMEAQQRRADREVSVILSRLADTPPYVMAEERRRELSTYPICQTR